MVFAIGESTYPINRAEQVLTTNSEYLTVFSTDENIDIEALDADIKANIDNGFDIDETHFTGFSLNCVRKTFNVESDTSISIEFIKSI